MKKRLTIFLAALVLLGARTDDRLRVVATLSTFADLVQTIGGEHVEVSTIASPHFNPHFIEPKPSDVLKVKRADLLVHAGLDLELWRFPLVDAAGNRDVMPGGTRELDLSRGIALLEVPDRAVTRAEGDIHIYGNPHYWMDPENAKTMARAIAEKLSALDSSHAEHYRHRLADFLMRLDQRISAWKDEAHVLQDQEVIAYHRTWPYFAQFTGLRIDQFLEPKPGIPPTPKQLSALETHIREYRIPILVQESFVPQGAAKALARRTGIAVVTLCQNVGEQSECSDYFAMLEYNIDQLVEALAP